MVKVLRRSLVVLLILLLTPVGYNAATYNDAGVRWYEASLARTGLAPDPAIEPRAVVQVYAARAFGWRGIFAVHTWIVTKRPGEGAYTRYDVVGWGGGRTIRINRHAPDAEWFGSRPRLLVDRRGPEAAALIPRIEAAVESYPFPETYQSWPGPNSNTFVAHVGRSVPELGLDLPANAIGKDYLPLTDPLATAPSGDGVQFSLLGTLGILAAPAEGVEVNLLGLSVGLDFTPFSLRLPALGRWVPGERAAL